jgi:hypothetical protein
MGFEDFLRTVKDEDIPHGISLTGMKDQKHWY